MVMLQSFFSSKTRVRLLQLFVNDRDKRYYLREISKILNEPVTPIRRELINLERVGLLRKTKVANLLYYSVNNQFLLFNELQSMVEKAIASSRQNETTTALRNEEVFAA